MKPPFLVIGIIVAAAGAVLIAGNVLQLGAPTPNSAKYLELAFASTTLPDSVTGTLTEGGSSNIVLDIRAWGSSSGTVTVTGGMQCTGEPILDIGLETLALTTAPSWFRLRMDRTSIAKGTSCTISLEAYGTPTVWWNELVLWGYAPVPGSPPPEGVTSPSPGSSTQTGSGTPPPPPKDGADLLRLGWILAGTVILLVGLLLAAVGLS